MVFLRNYILQELHEFKHFIFIIEYKILLFVIILAFKPYIINAKLESSVSDVEKKVCQNQMDT